MRADWVLVASLSYSWIASTLDTRATRTEVSGRAAH